MQNTIHIARTTLMDDSHVYDVQVRSTSDGYMQLAAPDQKAAETLARELQKTLSEHTLAAHNLPYDITQNY